MYSHHFAFQGRYLCKKSGFLRDFSDAIEVFFEVLYLVIAIFHKSVIFFALFLNHLLANLL